MRDFVLFLVFSTLFLVPGSFAFVRARSQLKLQDRISAGTFATALLAYTALAVGVILASFLNAWPLPVTPRLGRFLGAALGLAGAPLYLAARLEMRSFRPTWALRTDSLITTGIYRFLRHPQNLGWGLLLAGIALLGRSGVALALTGAYVLACLLWLPVEGAFRERRFGSSYARYRQCTAALIRFRARRRED